MAIPAWKIMTALICGNTIVFKPSSDTPLCATRLVEILEKAELPKGVLNMVTGPGDAVGMSIVRHEKVRAVSFTGHKDTGSLILREAGLKRVGLEMGGKNGILVMDDADLDLALDGVIWGGFGTTLRDARRLQESWFMKKSRKGRNNAGRQNKKIEVG
jgi:aldehyde dehydrogenase (NAD+)